MRCKLLVLAAFVIIFGKGSFCQWQTVNSGISDTLVDGFFMNDSAAFVISSNGKVLKSMDRGLTWNLMTTLPGTYTSICAGHLDTIYAGGDNVYQSPDAGQTWILKHNFPLVMKDLLFFGASNGYLLMPNSEQCKIDTFSKQIDDYLVFETNDSGNSWYLRFGRISSTSTFQQADSVTAYLSGVNQNFANICEVLPGISNRKTRDHGHSWSQYFKIVSETVDLLAILYRSLNLQLSSFTKSWFNEYSILSVDCPFTEENEPIAKNKAMRITDR